MSNLWKMCCKMSWRFARLRTPKVKLRSFYKQKITLSSGISSDFLTNSRKFWEISGHCLQHLKNDSDLFCGTDFRVSRILFTGFMQQSWNFNSRMTNLEVPLIMFFLSECSANSIIYRDFTEIWDSCIAKLSSWRQQINFGIGLRYGLKGNYWSLIPLNIFINHIWPWKRI